MCQHEASHQEASHQEGSEGSEEEEREDVLQVPLPRKHKKQSPCRLVTYTVLPDFEFSNNGTRLIVLLGQHIEIA